MAVTLPYETSPDEVILRIEAKLRNPNVGRVVSTVLKDGPRAYRLATLYQIINPSTRDHHHWCLKINSFDRSKKSGWSFKPTHSVSMDDDGSQELAHLAELIQAANAGQLGEPTGDYHLVPAAQLDSIKALLRFAKRADSEQRMRVVRALLESLDVTSVPPAEWQNIFDAGSAGVRRTIAVSARLAEYRRVRDQLAALVASADVAEGDLQRVLKDNPWLFGSEYSELLSRRNWTRDDRLDFMLRRTADDYLEIIEIKTPFLQPLFRYDPSHDSYAPSAPLSAALGQVVRYIDEVERQRDSIAAKDGCDPIKIRARIIIGKDGDAKQQAALRGFNGHLHRIEVLTFDQLLRIADRVLSVFEDKLTQVDR
jgi:antiviral defense system Shedu protein SduA